MRTACCTPVFLDAPHILTPVDLAQSFNTPEDLGAAEASETDPALMPRAWWKTDLQRTKTIGAETSLELLRDVLSKDHYEVSPNIRFDTMATQTL